MEANPSIRLLNYELPDQNFRSTLSSPSSCSRIRPSSPIFLLVKVHDQLPVVWLSTEPIKGSNYRILVALVQHTVNANMIEALKKDASYLYIAKNRRATRSG